MVDCAFSQICSLMGDLSPRVRASAMSLLGTMKSVSRRYIEQGLDKKQKVVETDRSEVEEKSGSCGAFIHGLEDEFLEVRFEKNFTRSLSRLFPVNKFILGENSGGRSALYAFTGTAQYS